MSWSRVRWMVCGLCATVFSMSGGNVSGQESTAETAQAAKAKTSVLRLEGDTALWSVAIRPGQTDAFEQVMARLEAALKNSDQPQRRSQAEGWKVVRLNAPLPDGSIVYVHMIHPVVADANYSIMQILYDEFPDERRALYDLYRGAFDRNLSLAAGSVSLDLGEDDGSTSPLASVSVP